MMKPVASPEIQDIMKAITCHPSISIIMPFEPKMNLKTELAHQLKLVTDKIEKEVQKEYNDDLSELVIQKLKNLVKNLNFNTYKKSIAIFISPVFEKVLYLDIEVEQRIIIDDSFEIRDLVLAKKELQKYMVLLLSGKKSKVFLGNPSAFVKVKSNVPDHIAAYETDLPERVGNFSDPSHHKEVLLKKFLQQTDQGLSFLLKAYPLPIFVMGAEKVLGYFKSITKNEKNIQNYIHGNYEDATESELDTILKPFVNDWKKVKLDDIQQQMEKAAGAGKLATGIKDVCIQGLQHKGKLLIVEKDFMYSEDPGKESMLHPGQPNNKFSCVRDVVDELIEKVFEDGGDVEFVDEGMLEKYGHIALIQYY